MRPIWGFLVVLSLVLAACTGAPGEGQADDGAGDDAQATSPADDDANGGGDSGGATAEFCLNTTEEVSEALDVEAVEAAGTQNANVGGGCSYTTSDGTLVYAIAVIIGQNAEATIAAGLQTEGAVEIDGIGDEAVLMSAGGPLVVRVGDTIISQGPLPGVPNYDDAAAMRAAMEELGRAAADRL